MKPVSGGRPAKERIVRVKTTNSVGFFAHTTNSRFTLFTPPIFRLRNTVAVVIIYKEKANRVSSGKNFITKIIHPMCEIEEYDITFRI